MDTTDVVGAQARDDLEQLSRARSLALRRLASASRTRSQLEEYLLGKELDPRIIAEVLDRYVEVGLLDDRSYAEAFVRYRSSERGMSKSSIARELSRRGVADELAQDALESIEPEHEIAAALRIAQKRLRSLGSVEAHVRYRRVAGTLARKGYSSHVIRQVLSDAMAPEAGSVSDEALIDLED